ncbi:MAG: rRNA (cytosine967-C5)-methyltransferase [Micromonosporaceae bacterium]|nr:rRNA (cytosine967-C5)-methyltransferase [Micromonosporaceae bacterium]
MLKGGARRDGGTRDGGARRDGGTRRGSYRPRTPEDAARRVAFDAIAAVHRDDAYANLVLPRLLRERRLHGLDAAFATELAYGALRLTGTLDAVIADAAARDVARIDPPVRDALCLGAYQLLRTRVAPHAAVATTVDLVRVVAPGAVGFANAVLRRVSERDWGAWIERLAPDDNPVRRLALAYAHPEWIVRAFTDALRAGPDTDEITRALAADNDAAPVHLCARPGLITAAELAASVGGQVGRYSPYTVYLPGGSPGDARAVVDGRAHVQDEGSQLVAAALVAAPLDGEDRRWLDLCAGPGGKAGLLGALAAGRGARVTAVEVAPHRADLVAGATRMLPVDVIVGDGRDVGVIDELPTASFDRVLVDAPCTGLGSLRRRPESRWRRQPSDLPPLTRLQRELLGAALHAVRPGGVVAYVTCSPHPAETQVAVTEACRRSPYPVDFVDARALVPAGMPQLGGGPTMQLWPHRHGTDAMFLAVLRRTA